MNIIGKTVYLRAMEPEDMDLLRDMTNDPDIERQIVGWSFPISKTQQMDWYNKSINDQKSLRFVIVIKENDRVIGMLNLLNIDWKNGTATHGIRLSEEAPRKQGFGTDAVMTLMRYAFEELRLHRIDSGRVSDNVASAKLYEKCGFKVEGVQREAIYREGKYYDHIVTGLLSEEYYKVKKKLGY